ncbi:glycine--tRNA ligase [bacterium]|nr:glycine--tRNA ligase [bacterium]
MEQMDKLVTLCKRRGFVFQNSEVYSGLAGFWDYGPLGVELKRNIERFWWNYMVRRRDNVAGLDAALIGPEAVWVASGHVGAFHDALVDDKNSKERFRIDQLLYHTEEDAEAAEIYALEAIEAGVTDETKFWDGLKEKIGYYPLNPNTGKASRFTAPRQFNLMFKQGIGATGEGGQTGYLRAETCQPIFVDFDSVRVTARQRVPFGIAQIGKAFRNEINPRNFLFRAREFSQMELEFFVRPDSLIEQLKAAQVAETPGLHDQPGSLAPTQHWYEYWLGERRSYYTALGIRDEFLRIHDHPPEKLAHYAKAACDIEFLFPFGWGELEGIHHRGDYDLRQHQEHSGKKFEYFDDDAHRLLTESGMNKDEARRLATYLPNCIETSVGLDRTFLAVLTAAYDEDEQDTKHEGKEADIRIVLRLHPRLAPVTCAVFPLSKKLSGPDSKAYKLYRTLIEMGLSCEFDDAGSIGKRYRRMDEIGTPWCLTYDFDSEEDGAVTVRDRDSLSQDRVSLEEVPTLLIQKLSES